MTRLLILLAALILYVAPPVAQAFATSHVRPPDTALVQPTSADTEGTSGTDTEWTRGEIAAWVQAVGSVVAAFLGFLGGVLIKYRLDRRADRLRAEADRQNLESALRAELLSLDLACDTRINEFEKVLNEKPEREVPGGPHNFARMALPPRRVWMAHLGQIGELKGGNTEALVLVHSLFDSYDLVVETHRQRAGGQGVPREVLQIIVSALEKMREAIVRTGGPLFEQTTVDQSWWRRVFDF